LLKNLSPRILARVSSGRRSQRRLKLYSATLSSPGAIFLIKFYPKTKFPAGGGGTNGVAGVSYFFSSPITIGLALVF